MRFGRFHDRVEFITETRVSDGMGGGSSTWAIHATRWCEFVQLMGREKVTGDQIDNPIDARVRTRYVTGLTEAMRVRYKGTTYEILDIINVKNNNKEIEVNVKKMRSP